jgi:hypothetical protein
MNWWRLSAKSGKRHARFPTLGFLHLSQQAPVRLPTAPPQVAAATSAFPHSQRNLDAACLGRQPIHHNQAALPTSRASFGVGSVRHLCICCLLFYY